MPSSELLVGRRRELVAEQTRWIACLRDLLASINPGLEAVVDPTQKGSLRSSATLTRPSSAACRVWGSRSRPSSSPGQALSSASRPPTGWPPLPAWRRCSSSRGKVRYLKRATGGNKTLKRVFFQSAFCSLSHPASKAYYRRKRTERKTHHQAVIALGRRRVDVLHAMLRNREPYRHQIPTAV